MTARDEREPMPCPWCGSPAEVGTNDDGGSAPWMAAWVRCTKRPGCEAEGTVVKLAKPQDACAAAIAAWNRIARLAALGAECAGATEAWCVERRNFVRAGFDAGTLYASKLHAPEGEKLVRVLILAPPAEKETRDGE